MTDQISFTPERAVEDNVLAGAKARFYETGTSTEVTVYSDAAGTVPVAQPLVSDAVGAFAQVFYNGTVAVKCVVTKADDSAGWTTDPCALTPTASGTASETSATPFTGVPGTTVQEQLEQIYASNTDQTVNPQTIVQTGNSGNDYTLTAASTISNYAVGQMFLIRINANNTGAATLNIDGLGARAFQKYDDAGSLVALDANDLRQGAIVSAAYDGTRFVLVLNPDLLGLMPAAQASTGVGQLRDIGAGSGNALSLPAGGTWGFFFLAENASGIILNHNAGVAAGGTLLGSASAGLTYRGWAWKVQ